MPKNWKDFLQVDENRFLSLEVIRLPTEEGKIIYSTIGTEVLSSLAAADVSSMAPCSHEEADTRLFVHVADAVRKGVRTVDTDVVVLAIAMFNQIGADELWLAFGTQSNFWYIPVHDVVAGMDPRICATLPIFHALRGCDTVSAFSGRGKKTA